ncbi:MAG: antibiotic biosynthesis monooxygenase [Oxalicibacterium faecigallinarum]|uniref:putative quinol monooxygenase n=1 Tax=Oxalicibacterium faecigallinarum TaxID=573741 RepID=UPI002808A735|nr:antibiotic biosynthesis monooxygenase [Oxalicibacterium faecigallinarum]MDQ7969287.1 antibiotic biosynthesis monooxygenase [Oxalicibacterium faecigallinarum]
MVNLGLQVRLEAKPGKEKELEEFLQTQLSYALGEPGTVVWVAIKISPGVFGIFDAFADETGRKAHLEGEIAKALQGSAGASLLAKPPLIEQISILAAKLPGSGEVPDTLG